MPVAALTLALCPGLAGLRRGAAAAAVDISQAESIDSVRGLHVRDPHCRGRGDRDGRRYRRLACVASARRLGERFDSVAVLYEIRPTGTCCSSYRLARVRFLGGPGIP